jgi:hypothetical protein
MKDFVLGAHGEDPALSIKLLLTKKLKEVKFLLGL